MDWHRPFTDGQIHVFGAAGTIKRILQPSQVLLNISKYVRAALLIVQKQDWKVFWCDSLLNLCLAPVFIRINWNSVDRRRLYCHITRLSRLATWNIDRLEIKFCQLLTEYISDSTELCDGWLFYICLPCKGSSLAMLGGAPKHKVCLNVDCKIFINRIQFSIEVCWRACCYTWPMCSWMN